MNVKKMLNKELKDVVTGFRGVCIGYAIYGTGCTQVCVSPPVDKDGKLRGAEWFDIERVEACGAGIKAKSSKTGGPRSNGESAPAR